MELVKGYFTIERNIVGLNLRELESKLGFRPGRLTSGARILQLQRTPTVGEFAFAGSTRYSNSKGLVSSDKRQNISIPHAWLNQRLVKVSPNTPHSPTELYPSALSPVEQWELLVLLPAEVIRHLTNNQVYWP